MFKNRPYQKNQLGRTIQEEKGEYLVTAYYTEPNNICNAKGRKEGYVGNNLYLVISPNKTMKIPLKEKDVLKDSKWVKGKCFPTMGKLSRKQISIKF